MRTIKDAMTNSRKATTSAFNRWDTVRGVSTDPLMRRYETMTSEDFTKLVQRFGPDATAKFIQAVEIRRLKMQNGG